MSSTAQASAKWTYSEITCAPERYVRVDFDSRDGIEYAGAQSDILKQDENQASSLAFAPASNNSRNAEPVSLPKKDEVADLSRLVRHLYDRKSTRIKIQKKFYRSRHFSARSHRIIADEAKDAKPFETLTSNVVELSNQIESSRLQCA